MNVTIVPRPGSLRISHAPPISASRRRMFASPLPRAMRPAVSVAVRRSRRVKATPVVSHLQRQLRRLQFQFHAHFACRRVFDDIVQRLFEREKHIVPHFGGHRQRRQLQRQVQPAADARRAQPFVRESSQDNSPGFPACRGAG